MFKLGDKVRCLVDNGQTGIYSYLVKDKIYTVHYADANRIGIEKSERFPIWNNSRFELVKEKEEMKKIPYLKNENSIVLIFNGGSHVIAKEDDRFGKVLTAIREERWHDIPEIVNPLQYMADNGIEVEDGIVKMNGEEMPPELNSRIMEYKRENIPFGSLINFWKNLQQNPSFNSRQQLFKFLENKGHAITEDGCFVGYRGVTEDFKDRHSKTFDNRPGQRCEMPRDMVDDNPNNTCSHGLHVGGYEYARDFASGGKLVTVKVNPKDVVAVPNDYNGQKMRVCAFEVLDEATDIVARPVVNQNGGEDLTLKPEVKPLHCSIEGVAIPSTVKFKREKRERTDKLVSRTRYANNHNKRGPDGRFVSNKRRRK